MRYYMLTVALVLGQALTAQSQRSPDELFRSGADNFTKKNHPEAISDFTAYIELGDPSQPSVLSGFFLATAYFFRGQSHLASGNEQAAIDDMTQSLAIEGGLGPYRTQAYFSRGSAYHQLGKDENAVEDFSLFLLEDFNDDRPQIDLRAVAYLWRGGGIFQSSSL